MSKTFWNKKNLDFFLFFSKQSKFKSNLHWLHWNSTFVRYVLSNFSSFGAARRRRRKDPLSDTFIESVNWWILAAKSTFHNTNYELKLCSHGKVCRRWSICNRVHSENCSWPNNFEREHQQIRLSTISHRLHHFLWNACSLISELNRMLDNWFRYCGWLTATAWCAGKHFILVGHEWK